MASPQATEKLLTADEFMALDDDPEGRAMELDDGRVVYMPQPNERHSDIARVIFMAIYLFAAPRSLQKVVFDVGFTLRREPDRIVSPDVAWIDVRRLPANRDTDQFFPVAPTLAVEIASPNDRDRDIVDKAFEYLDAGSDRVWIVRPRSRTVTVHRPNGDSHTYRMGDMLASDDAALPDGFALTLEAIFATE